MTVYLYTGTSGGKTTNALGIALRSLAYGKKVLMVQFLKWFPTGEIQFSKELGLLQRHEYNKLGKFIIKQYGRKGWQGVKKLTKEDHDLCERAVTEACAAVVRGDVNVLILDEINFAYHYKMVSLQSIQQLIKLCRDMGITVVMTGRYADQELIDLSDIANKIVCMKAPPEGVLINEEGVQY